jgi:hypothetical protein
MVARVERGVRTGGGQMSGKLFRGRAAAPARPTATGVVLRASFATLFLVLALVALMRFPWSFLGQYWEARSWPQSTAQLTSVLLREEDLPDFAGIDIVTDLVLEARYVYAVGGERFEGQRASIDDHSDVLDRRLKRLFHDLEFAHVQQRDVEVYYDPDRPERALLDRSFPWRETWLPLAFAALFFWRAMTGLIRLRRSLKLAAQEA